MVGVDDDISNLSCSNITHQQTNDEATPSFKIF
jgi:hypothetical protein